MWLRKLQHYRVEDVLRDLPEILRLPVNESVDRPNITPSDAFPQIPTELLSNEILSRAGLRHFATSKSMLSNIPRSILEETCFDGVSKEEIMSSFEFVKSNPGQYFDFGFFILSITNSLLHYFPITGSVTYIGDEHFSFSDGIARKIESFDTIIQIFIGLGGLEAQNYTNIVCVLPCPTSINMFVSLRSICSTIPNYTTLYYNKVIDALLSIVVKYPMIVIEILLSEVTNNKIANDALLELIPLLNDEQANALIPYLEDMKI